jgi:hypothetical protein
MGRPTTASRCSQEAPVVVAGKPITVVCQKALAHKGEHQGPVKWPPRAAAPPPGRQL